MADSKFCSSCGTALNEGATFCSSCGAKVEAPANSQPEASLSAPIEENVAKKESSSKNQKSTKPKRSKKRAFKGRGCLRIIPQFFIFIILPVIIVGFIVWFAAAQLGGGDEETGGSTAPTEESVIIAESKAKEPAVTEVKQYSGCGGLEDLIPKLKSVGGASMSWYQVAKIGDKAACDNLIDALNKQENYKD